MDVEDDGWRTRKWKERERERDIFRDSDASLCDLLKVI